ncbi:unnamed protein product [Parascedosporium putredinis]|uniref:RNA polymerase II degradation factor 1 n=1 Tax=Parascedosporium putredinis TaxID=1442378 RepID=A0A9P1H759_9PEZI|nr:unnamed protein product [Parascedosporium putredinis]CAI7999344.1 unnamed protein product [Parascedosporium putredinis]
MLTQQRTTQKHPQHTAPFDALDTPSPAAFDEDGDIAELRKLYGSKVRPIKDMFEGWSEVDILYALQEAEGDEGLAVERIAHGAVSQWGEVSKSKKTRSKPKDAVSASATADTHSGPRPSRGGRIVSESGRGRGRGVDRGGRAPRSRPAQPATNGTRKESGLSVPTEESNAWDTKKSGSDTRGNAAPEQPAAAAEPAKAAPPTKTWASMLRQATAPKIAPKPKEAPAPKPAESLEPLPPCCSCPHYQRRILDQEEAVRMPGNREVDRAAVQFGAFSLNGGEEDVDGEREEAETRAQPPDDSPSFILALRFLPRPRSLRPPPKRLPLSPSRPLPPPTRLLPLLPKYRLNSRYLLKSFGRYGAQEGAPGLPSLNQQGAAASNPQQQYENYQAQQQASQVPHSSGAFSSAPGDFSSYYTADHQNRGPYNNYYGQQYGQQHQASQGQQEGAGATQQPQPQRAFSGYNNASQADNLAQYPQSGVGLHNQSRFGGVSNDPQSSGHTTPNPRRGSSSPARRARSRSLTRLSKTTLTTATPISTTLTTTSSTRPTGRAATVGHPTARGRLVPAGGFQSSLHRDNNGVSSGLGEYGRVGSAQSGHQAGLGGSSFGGMHDTFGRGPSSYQSQAGQGFNAQSQAAGSGSGNDDLKPYVDSNHLQQGLHGSSGYGMGGANSAGQHGNTPYGSYGQGGFGGSGYYGGAGQQQQQQQQQQQRGGWGGNYNH